MRAQPSVVHSHLPGRLLGDRGPIQLTAADAADPNVQRTLASIGIDIARLRAASATSDLHAWANDAAPNAQASTFAATVPTPAQFLQAWLPGWVSTVTAVQMIDEILGVSTVGAWEDEEVIQGALEHLGLAQPYGDYNATPLASFNPSYERRTVVRFEQGFEIGQLEAARTARARLDAAGIKRASAAASLNIQRNRLGFWGYNNGSNRTYGFLNDPSLPAYVTFANGASASPAWSTKTFLEILTDIRAMVAALVLKAGGLIRVNRTGGTSTPLTLVLPLAVDTYLAATSDTGAKSVAQWIAETYPSMRILTAPELNGANGGVNAAYLYADRIQDDASTDDGKVWDQLVPVKFMTIGSEKRIKTYVEDFGNATAGALLKRPYAVVRYSGC